MLLSGLSVNLRLSKPRTTVNLVRQHGGSPGEIAASGDYKNSDREKIISRGKCSVRPARAVAKATGLSRGAGFIGKFDI